MRKDVQVFDIVLRRSENQPARSMTRKEIRGGFTKFNLVNMFALCVILIYILNIHTY